MPRLRRVSVSLGRRKEKVDQLSSNVPAIERLGVPEFDYHNDALHGISEAPGGVLAPATSFPQAIAMDSTWNPVLMLEMITAVSDEVRAFCNLGKMPPSIWSPNINVLRDPRWGRNDEAYSEDPFLVKDQKSTFSTVMTVLLILSLSFPPITG